MNLPLNGRVAIIDDQLKHAEPILKVLSRKQIPLTYFSGELKYLPEQNTNLNDIRILFLDVNLIDDGEHSNSVLKSKLIPVLNRVISEKNYPYVIIYWSRHEHHKALIEEDIFVTELKNKKPISFLSATKSDYFGLDGNPTEDIETNLDHLIDKVNGLIQQHPAYSYLINWENQVHFAADKTLQKVFNAYYSFNNWSDNANFLINKFGKSYAGKSFSKLMPAEKLKSSFQAFNGVFIDSLEYSTNNTEIENCVELKYDTINVDQKAIFSINKNLLFSDEKEPKEYSGAVTEDQNPRSDAIFGDLLNNCMSRIAVKDFVKSENTTALMNEKDFEKKIDKKAKEVRAKIKSNWKKVYCIVTPLCDYVQQKFAYCRVVKGIIIESSNKNFIDDKSEAIFISPEFRIGNTDCILILHFRYFFTTHNSKGVMHLDPLFRIRLQLLAEIQSKLARHISRQGVLFLDTL